MITTIKTEKYNTKNLGNFFIDDSRTALFAQQMTTTFEIKKKVNEDTGATIKILGKKEVSKSSKLISFSLTKITENELSDLRAHGIPSFVLKENGAYYHCAIPDTLSLVSSNLLGLHLCSSHNTCCKHLSAATDEAGGCAKVREKSSGIENYPWITHGYETFNTKQDCFVVASCAHYEQCSDSKPKLSLKQISALKLGIAQYVFDDVKSQAEVREKLIKNGTITEIEAKYML